VHQRSVDGGEQNNAISQKTPTNENENGEKRIEPAVAKLGQANGAKPRDWRLRGAGGDSNCFQLGFLEFRGPYRRSTRTILNIRKL
jgi:hypothetical protein